MFHGPGIQPLQAVLFSHPGDFTPVCTTELGEVARRTEDFQKRGVKVIGISANSLSDHNKWVEDINDFGSRYGPTNVQFPIVSTTVRQSVCGALNQQRYRRLPMKNEKSLRFTTCLTNKMSQIGMRKAFPLP
jgi:alkyl hydroperoxide reductase subunit AhpC